MIEIKDILRRNNIIAHNYRKLGNNIVIDDKYVIKKNNKKEEIHHKMGIFSKLNVIRRIL